MSEGHVLDRLSALLDGELAAEEEREVLEHLATCEECRDSREDLSEILSVVRSIPDPEAPEGFAEQVLVRLPVRRRFGRLLWMTPVAAAAGLLVLASLATRPPAPRASGVGETNQVASAPADSEAPNRKRESADRAAGGPVDIAFGGGGAGGGPGQDDAGSIGRAVAGHRDRPFAPDPGTGASERIAPAGAAAPTAPQEKSAEVDETIRMVVRGVEPDAVAGVLLAELDCLRQRTDGDGTVTSFAETKCAERVVPDESGVPQSLMLCVTSHELELVERLLSSRHGARFSRNERARDPAPAKASSGAKPEEESRAAAGERLRVEIRFAK